MSLIFISYFSIFSYFLVYCLASIFIFICLWFVGVSRISRFFFRGFFFVLFFFLIGLFSLAGVPPFLGFLGKWFAIQELVFSGYFFICFFLIVSSLVSLFFYFGVVFSCFFLVFFNRFGGGFLGGGVFVYFSIFILFGFFFFE